jgi:hypothetical protein
MKILTTFLFFLICACQKPQDKNHIYITSNADFFKYKIITPDSLTIISDVFDAQYLSHKTDFKELPYGNYIFIATTSNLQFETQILNRKKQNIYVEFK